MPKQLKVGAGQRGRETGSGDKRCPEVRAPVSKASSRKRLRDKARKVETGQKALLCV